MDPSCECGWIGLPSTGLPRILTNSFNFFVILHRSQHRHWLESTSRCSMIQPKSPTKFQAQPYIMVPLQSTTPSLGLFPHCLSIILDQ